MPRTRSCWLKLRRHRWVGTGALRELRWNPGVHEWSVCEHCGVAMWKPV